MKQFVALILVLVLVLCGCGSAPVETIAPETQSPVTEAPATQPPVTESTEPPATEPPTEETTAPTEAVPTYTHPLTGEGLEQPCEARTIAVMINNVGAALPQCGIGEADIIYEILSEGSDTRFMAIFTGVADIPTIGPVRSLRPYFFKIMTGYDAICTSAGGSEEAYTLVYGSNWDYMNGINNASANYFYRDQWRRENKGYEHSLFVTGQNLDKGIHALGMRATVKDGMDYRLTFTEEVLTEGQDAGQITVRFRSKGKTTKLTYQSDLGAYTAYQKDQDLIDGNTNQLVLFRNVLVLWSDSYVKDDEGHLYVQTTGSGSGYYARDGKIIPINWSRDSESAPFVYTDSDGNPITFGVGKSYIAILPNGSPVDFN